MKMPPPMEAILETLDIIFFLLGPRLLSVTIGCGSLSTAWTEMRSWSDSREMVWQVPALARSIFVFPPGTEQDMEPERSRTMLMAVMSFILSFFISMETGSSSSMGEEK